MSDLTIIYYTANRTSEFFEKNIIQALKDVAGDSPIVSVSFKPMDLGENIVYQAEFPSAWHIYKQILVAAEKATTKYVACAEDDTVYTKEHLAFRPPDDTFAYNEGHIEIRFDNKFIHRGKRNMSTCIANRDLMVDTLRKRFEKYPIPLEPAQTGGFAEPGRYEWKLKLPPVKIMGFSTDPPPVVFWHRPSLGGIRALKSSDVITTDHPYWGNAKEMFDKFYKKP